MNNHHIDIVNPNLLTIIVEIQMENQEVSGAIPRIKRNDGSIVHRFQVIRF